MSDLKKTVDGIMSIVSDHLDGLPEAEQVERLKGATEVPVKENQSDGEILDGATVLGRTVFNPELLWRFEKALPIPRL